MIVAHHIVSFVAVILNSKLHQLRCRCCHLLDSVHKEKSLLCKHVQNRIVGHIVLDGCDRCDHLVCHFGDLDDLHAILTNEENDVALVPRCRQQFSIA